MNRVKLRKMVIRGFRGVLQPTVLDFSDDFKGLVLFGNNADGKSSFADAIEWYFTDKIVHLEPEGCGREDYFNKALPENENATVELEFNLPTVNSVKTLKRKGGHEFSNKSQEFQNFLNKTPKESIILRYDTMRKFVDMTKKEKLEEVEEIIGFGFVREVRDTLLRTVNTLKDDRALLQMRGQLEERRQGIAKLLGKAAFEVQDIIGFADGVRKELDLNQPIIDLDSVVTTANELEKQTIKTGKGEKLAHLETLQKRVVDLYKIKDIIEKLKDAITKQNNMAQRKEMIEASVLEKLYLSAKEVLEKEWTKSGECPLCKSPFDTDVLLESLHEKIGQIKDVLSERKTHIEELKSLTTDLTTVTVSINELQKEDTKAIISMPEQLMQINNWADRIREWKAISSKMQDKAEAVLVELPDEKNLGKFNMTISSIESGIKRQKEVLAETEDERKFYRNVEKFKTLRDNLVRIQELQVQTSKFERQISSIQNIFDEFEKRERDGLNAVLLAISSDVNKFFSYLHPEEKIDGVQLVQPEARGIEFKIRFHGVELSPPRKVLSESHLNSLGVCLFMASARHFNKVNSFILLDDVVSSFDSNHRITLARLLRDEFPEMQIILFTHDDLWFTQLKDNLPQDKWVFKETKKWTIERGIELIESPPSLKEEILWLLERNDASTASNRCRVLIEELLKDKLEKLGVRGLEFRVGRRNDEREAKELLDAIVAYLKENQTLRSQEHKILFDDLRADQLLMNIGSHHRTLQSTSPSRGDVETVMRDVEEFQQLFVCKDCGKEANKIFSPRNAKIKQCKCGNLKI